MLIEISVLFGVVVIAGGSAAFVQHRKVRASRRRHARNLSVALVALQRHRQLTMQAESKVA